MSTVELHLDDGDLDRLAELVAERIAARLNGATESSSSPWLSAEQAAAYLACPVSRVRKLTMTGDLPTHRDGRRTLYRRDELDGYIARGGAVSP